MGEIFFGESAESPGHSPSGENTFLKSLFFRAFRGHLVSLWLLRRTV
jgi:hypothetical protein